MKKCISLILALTIVLASCGNDDDDDKRRGVEESNQLTKVTCVKNNASSPAFVLNITYNQDRQIADIVREGAYTDVCSYTMNSMIVNRFSADGNTSLSLNRKMQYSLSNGGILKSEEYLKNPYKNDEEYLANVYTYAYTKNRLINSSWVEAHWPKADGTGYDSRTTLEAYGYVWVDGNTSLYNMGTKEVAFTYKDDLQPESFPLHFVNTFDLVNSDVVSPLNSHFGNHNKNLVETAVVYILPDVESLHAKYTFSYNSTGDFITGMTVKEEIFPASGSPAATNTYTYSFEYNYK